MSAQKSGDGHQSKSRVFRKRSSVAARMPMDKARNAGDEPNMPQLAHIQDHPLLATDSSGPGPSGGSSRRHPRPYPNCVVNTQKSYQGAKPSSPSKTVKIGPNYFGTPIPEHIMEDILFRFLYNIPDNEKSVKVRVCFQVEQAHWFYVDFYCSAEEQQHSPENLCKELGFREFARQVFFNCDYLHKWKSEVETIIDEFRFYKSNVPTYGIILLDSSLNYVLLVQGYFASKNSWGFPKGKVNEDEIPIQCAIREVFEETGYDATEKIVSNRRPLQYFLNDTLIRLYIATDVPMDHHFEPHLRKEIRKITWFSVWDLPKDRMDEEGCKRLGLTPNNFYGVLPFVNDIQDFVRREQAKRQKPKITILRKESSAFEPVVPKGNRVGAEVAKVPFSPIVAYNASTSGTLAAVKSGATALAATQSAASTSAAAQAISGSALDALFFKPVCPEKENNNKQFGGSSPKVPQSYTGVSFLQKFFDSSAPSSSKTEDEAAQLSVSPDKIQSAVVEDDTINANVDVELCKSWKQFSFDRSRIVLPF